MMIHHPNHRDLWTGCQSSLTGFHLSHVTSAWVFAFLLHAITIATIAITIVTIAITIATIAITITSSLVSNTLQFFIVVVI